ncbi:alpha-L-fucosidase [Mariniflexile sp. AS56]|uniref:alpha-L-fucosidase n=1 Tax=Mariniflexile sp. AS56 TaxID=3063957 RepID=UPI0026F1202B|nr:alpha-L-fucosidase [Mariniflexile sp. AS56]MDO7172537.1 alpha-L-fucosidase [Mariniflexile sp. AS56]
MKKIIVIMCISLSQLVLNAQEAPYKPTLESLSNHVNAPEWLVDAKLGIYFHWGLYSVPAYSNEWYPWYMYKTDDNEVAKYHRETYGDPTKFNYHDFAPMFTAEHFDAANWAKLFKEAGAKFAGPVAIHHDGFAMWDSKVNPWNSKDKGPKKDITGLLLKELKKEGLKTITTFHHARTLQRNADNPAEWEGFTSHFAYNPEFVTASTDPNLRKLYGNMPASEFHDYWFAELKEVVDQYSPDIVWFDSWLNMIPEQYRNDFAAYYFNEANKKKQEVALVTKQYDYPKAFSVLDIEQGGKKDLSESVWMTDVTLGLGSWCYTNGLKYKSADLVLRNMIDVWSKNGIVLLNLSPRKDGVIPQEQRDVVLEVGEWLKTYGESVYGTRPYKVYGFGNANVADGHFGGQSAETQYSADDIRFTRSKDEKTVYVFFLGKPEIGKTVGLRILGPHRYPLYSKLKRVTLLGSDVEAKFKVDSDNVFITIPDAKMDDLATVFKFELE